MKKLNQSSVFVLFAIILCFLISSCNGCGPVEIEDRGVRIYQELPCERYHHGAVRFENTSKDNIIVVYKHTEYSLRARSAITINELSSMWHFYTYEKGRNVGGSQFEICDCETTLVSLPSRRNAPCSSQP